MDSVPFHKVFAGFGSSAALKYSSTIQVRCWLAVVALEELERCHHLAG